MQAFTEIREDTTQFIREVMILEISNIAKSREKNDVAGAKAATKRIIVRKEYKKAFMILEGEETKL